MMTDQPKTTEESIARRGLLGTAGLVAIVLAGTAVHATETTDNTSEKIPYPETPSAIIDGTSQGWCTLGEKDFVKVNSHDNCSTTTGYLCLEAEGSPIEFRNIRFRELP